MYFINWKAVVAKRNACQAVTSPDTPLSVSLPSFQHLWLSGTSIHKLFSNHLVTNVMRKMFRNTATRASDSFGIPSPGTKSVEYNMTFTGMGFRWQLQSHGRSMSNLIR